MFTRVKDMVKNHWKKVVVGAVGVQAVIYGAKYAAGQLLAYHEAEAMDHWKKIKKENHFQSMESTFKNSFVPLAINLKESVIQCLDAESLTNQLKTEDLAVESKLEIWGKLKVIGFARVIVVVYGTSLLTLLLRLQLSVIGGYLFIESNETERKHEWRNVNGVILSNNTAIDTDLQQKYLSLASYLVKTGIQKLCDYVYTRTAAVVGSIGLKEKITVTKLEEIFLKIVSAVHQDITASSDSSDESISPVKYPWKYIYPTDVLESHDYFRNTVQNYLPHYEPPDIYERLLSETFDLLDSDDVGRLLASFERQGVSHFCDRVADYIASEPSVKRSSQVDVFSEVELPLAKIIPMLNGLVSQGMNESDPWLNVLTTSESSRTFAANVYESFSNSLD